MCPPLSPVNGRAKFYLSPPQAGKAIRFPLAGIEVKSKLSEVLILNKPGFSEKPDFSARQNRQNLIDTHPEHY